MPTVIAFHDVDDVDHWLDSPKREEVFGPHGITVQTFVDPEGSKRTGLIMGVPDMAELQEVMTSEAGAEAIEYDGVHSDTVVMLVESQAWALFEVRMRTASSCASCEGSMTPKRLRTPATGGSVAPGRAAAPCSPLLCPLDQLCVHDSTASGARQWVPS